MDSVDHSGLSATALCRPSGGTAELPAISDALDSALSSEPKVSWASFRTAVRGFYFYRSGDGLLAASYPVLLC